MEIAGEALVRHDVVFLGISADLVSVHAYHGDLNRASKVEVVVAQVIGRGLKLILGHISCIVHYLVQDRLGSSDCSLMRDHIEVKGDVSLIFDNNGVNDCAVARIEVVLVGLHENTVLDVAVNQAIEDLGLVSWRGFLEQVSDLPHFVLLDLSSHCGTTHAVSINDDLLRETFSIFLIITHGIINEILKDFGSLNCCEQLLDFFASLALVLFHLFLRRVRHILLVQSGIALSESF
jgi:hypothetical protein